MFILTIHLSTSACWVNGQIYCLTRWASLSRVRISPRSPGWTDAVSHRQLTLGLPVCWGLGVSRERLQEQGGEQVGGFSPGPHHRCGPLIGCTLPHGWGWHCPEARALTQAWGVRKLERMGDIGPQAQWAPAQ